ncbi:hypothetical protein SY83_01250 [Paenibacillus swuensis]|uniref:Futalosine hydrolase n=1 Tax=Paenibacillus swuensis TaxID=1178515 RepID=A0A172TNH3_9BACL|nr:hypothetical protein SY83_01250 [Paenibacillus swuensis]
MDPNYIKRDRILIVTAVEAEREALLRGLGRKQDDRRSEDATGAAETDNRNSLDAAGAGRVHVIAGGVGPAAAAASTSAALATAGGAYAAVISAGIGGGFAGQAEIGSLVLASEIVCADLGAEAPPQDFVSIDQLGFGTASYTADAPLTARLAEALRAAGLPLAAGPVLTVSTVTGTAETAARLAQRVPGATAEAMEGFGVAAAAQLHGVPVVELRAVSNAVGLRDRGAWRIKEALAALEAAGAVLAEVFEHECDE